MATVWLIAFLLHRVIRSIVCSFELSWTASSQRARNGTWRRRIRRIRFRSWRTPFRASICNCYTPKNNGAAWRLSWNASPSCRTIFVYSNRTSKTSRSNIPNSSSALVAIRVSFLMDLCIFKCSTKNMLLFKWLFALNKYWIFYADCLYASSLVYGKKTAILQVRTNIFMMLFRCLWRFFCFYPFYPILNIIQIKLDTYLVSLLAMYRIWFGKRKIWIENDINMRLTMKHYMEPL